MNIRVFLEFVPDLLIALLADATVQVAKLAARRWRAWSLRGKQPKP